MTMEIRRSLPVQTAELLGRRIASGQYATGQQITYELLERSLGIGQTSVQEAARILQSKGMVSIKPNVGTRVRPPSDWNQTDPDVQAWLQPSPAPDVPRIKRNLSFQAAAMLGQQIANGTLATGDLVDAEGLCRSLRMSRSSVRWAIKVLEDKGLLSVLPNSGTRVRPPADWNLLDADVIAWLHGTALGDDVAQAAADLVDVLARTPMPGNPLYVRMVELLKGFRQ